MDLIVFGFNDWHEWSATGFRTRSAITIERMSGSADVHRTLVVSSPSSIWANALRVSAGAISGQPVRPGTTLRSHAVSQVAEGVWALDHFRLLPREDTYPAARALNAAWHDESLCRETRAARDALGMSDVVLWVANPLMAKHIGSFGERLSVFDAIDDWSVHPAKVSMRAAIAAGYETVRARADVVFTVSQALAARFMGGKPEVHWVPNGVDAQRFDVATSVPCELEELPRPLLGYVGTLQERVDPRTLAEVARRLPHASIVLVGPVVAPSHFAGVANMPNVHFLGVRPTERVPAFVNSFDVCLLPHVDDQFTRSMNPMKLYEYLASGNPIVASGPMDESVRPLVYHARGCDEFASLVENALREDDPGARERRKDFARSRSWDSVVTEMLSVIKADLS